MGRRKQNPIIYLKKNEELHNVTQECIKLHQAIASRNIPIATLLINSNKISVLYEPDLMGFTALECAYRYGNPILVAAIKKRIKREYEGRIHA